MVGECKLVLIESTLVKVVPEMASKVDNFEFHLKNSIRNFEQAAG